MAVYAPPNDILPIYNPDEFPKTVSDSFTQTKANALYVKKVGDTMTGALNINNSITALTVGTGGVQMIQYQFGKYLYSGGVPAGSSSNFTIPYTNTIPTGVQPVLNLTLDQTFAGASYDRVIFTASHSLSGINVRLINLGGGTVSGTVIAHWTAIFYN
jgi:hypothetical protein